MNRRSVLLLLLASTLGLTASAQTPTPAPAKHRVIFGLTSGDAIDWQMTLGNARNLINGLKPEPVEVEIVAYSAGIMMIKADSSVATDIAALQVQGVRFVACGNAMHFHKLELKDLLPGVTSVPAGIVEVVTKQEQGWTYIKGGR